MNVFDAFPNAIISGVWQIGTVDKSTEIGDVYTAVGYVDVIIDEVASGEQNKSPDADGITVSTLIYIRPEQMPGLNIARLISSYFFYDSANGQYYEIKNVGVGKNQQTGAIEHIEFELLPVEAITNE